MANPRTVNTGIIVPLTGADVDLWGEVDVNPNMVAIDGLIGGVQAVAVTNVPVTLSSPAGFAATPSPGPTQSQNRVLRFTGVLTANVQVTIPLPGVYAIENLTTGAFVLSFRAIGVGEVIAVDQGEVLDVYCDGTNVRFLNLGRIGVTEIWAGLTAIPAWVAACTKKPYLQCDGTVYNFSDYPYLGARLLGKFGGNGITTFAVPDLSGRIALPYDKTGTRITQAGAGLNGQNVGAALDQQTVTLTYNTIPKDIPYTLTWDFSPDAGSATRYVGNSAPVLTNVAGGTAAPLPITFVGVSFDGSISVSGGSINPNGGLAHNNVQPSQVTGLSVIRAA